MSVTEFLNLVGQCHRTVDLVRVFNGNWHRVTGTEAELARARDAWGARYEKLREDGVAEGSNLPMRGCELQAA